MCVWGGGLAAERDRVQIELAFSHALGASNHFPRPGRKQRNKPVCAPQETEAGALFVPRKLTEVCLWQVLGAGIPDLALSYFFLPASLHTAQALL